MKTLKKMMVNAARGVLATLVLYGWAKAAQQDQALQHELMREYRALFRETFYQLVGSELPDDEALVESLEEQRHQLESSRPFELLR